MTTDFDVRMPDGRTIRAVDGGGSGPVVMWHHGTPHTGALLEPLLTAATARGLRLVSYARPGYGGSTAQPGRDVASAAGDVAAIADTLGVETFATVGSSGGAPHALACAALLPERVSAVAAFSGLAPYDGGDDWFAGMADDGALRSALEGRAARARYAGKFDPAVFTDADFAALNGDWAAVGADAGAAAAADPEGAVDDDVAFVSPWGFDPGTITAPVLIVHGDDDRMVPVAHARRLLTALRDATFWHLTGYGHVSVLAAYPDALSWLAADR